MSNLKVNAGDKLSATKWNALVDRVAGGAAGNVAGLGLPGRVEAEVYNDSGRNYDLGEVIHVSDFEGPSEAHEATRALLLTGELPVWHTKIANLAVTAEPIPDEEFGIVVLYGLCVIAVTSTGDDDYLMINPTTVHKMTAATSGIARQLGRVDDDYVIGIMGDRQIFWRYEMTEDSQAPNTTECKLIGLDGTTEHAATIDLTDDESYMDNQVTKTPARVTTPGTSFMRFRRRADESSRVQLLRLPGQAALSTGQLDR